MQIRTANISARLEPRAMAGEPKKPGKGPGDGDGKGTEHERGVAIKERTRTQKPSLYKVLLHNDDYTTKEFVVMILQAIFNKDEQEAVRVMMAVHNNGVGVAGVYTYEIAETKVAKTLQLAQAHEYPLQASLEPE
jgi:ATP-dependent Clp protease adaptor protein ClpS